MNEGAEGVVVRPLAKRTGVKPAVVGAEAQRVCPGAIRACGVDCPCSQAEQTGNLERYQRGDAALGAIREDHGPDPAASRKRPAPLQGDGAS